MNRVNRRETVVSINCANKFLSFKISFHLIVLVFQIKISNLLFRTFREIHSSAAYESVNDFFFSLLEIVAQGWKRNTYLHTR